MLACIPGGLSYDNHLKIYTITVCAHVVLIISADYVNGSRSIHRHANSPTGQLVESEAILLNSQVRSGDNCLRCLTNYAFDAHDMETYEGLRLVIGVCELCHRRLDVLCRRVGMSPSWPWTMWICTDCLLDMYHGSGKHAAWATTDDWSLGSRTAPKNYVWQQYHRTATWQPR